MQTTEPTTRRGLVRRPAHRLIAGVAGGLADATGTPTGWWRLGFVFLTLVGGLGVAVYLILWIVIPRADRPRSTGQRIAERFPGMPGWVGVALLGLGVVLLVGHYWPTGVLPYYSPPFGHQIRHSSPGFAVAVLLIGLGILLFRRNGDADELDRPVATVNDALPAPPRPARTPRTPRERSVTGWLSFGIALTATGVAWLLLNTGSADLSLTQMLALPLAILGAGLVLGSVLGRARWTVLLGLPLVPLVLASSLIPTSLVGRYTDRYVTPRTGAQVKAVYEQSGGTLLFDFTKLRPGEHPGAIRAAIGLGNIQVLLPKGMAVNIDGSVGLGSIELLGGVVEGVGVSDSLHRGGANPIVMTLESGIGNVYVYYESAPHKPKPTKRHPTAPGQPSPPGGKG